MLGVPKLNNKKRGTASANVIPISFSKKLFPNFGCNNKRV